MVLYKINFNETPIWSAIRRGYTDVVKLLLKHKEIDINSRIIYHFNFFHKISRSNFIMEFFILFNKTIMDIANKVGNLEIINLLISSKTENNEYFANMKS